MKIAKWVLRILSLATILTAIEFMWEYTINRPINEWLIYGLIIAGILLAVISFDLLIYQPAKKAAEKLNKQLTNTKK